MTSASTPPELLEAHRLLKAGQRQEAGAILKPYLAQHRDDARAWWLMAHAASSPDAVRQCLEQVLRIEPGYEQARARLAALAPVPETRPPDATPSKPLKAPAETPAGEPDDEPDDYFFFPAASAPAAPARRAEKAPSVQPVDAAPAPTPRAPTVPSFEEFAARTSADLDPVTGEPVDNPFAGIDDAEEAAQLTAPPSPRAYSGRVFDPAAHARLGRDDSSDTPPPE